MQHPAYFWIGFHVLIAILLILDFMIFQKWKIRFREACILSVFWLVLALLFNLFIYYFLSPTSALQFFTGYLIERSLSIDNLFVFLLIFLHFRVPFIYQRKVLFWGILGALVFRISLILSGVALVNAFHWMFYFLGAFLCFTGIRFAFQKKEKRDPSEGLAVRVIRKIFPVAKGGEDGRFFIREEGKWKITTLFLVLLLIEMADIVFALDSIPAIFAITTDPFIIYTSNIFSILGLRALYFVVAASLEKMHFYQYGLAAILVFVGAKMLLAELVPISDLVSLIVIVAILAVTVVISLTFKKKPA